MARRVLFVCTGNTCRSPMAEGLLRQLLQERGLQGEVLSVASAGLHAQRGASAAPGAQRVMESMGIDLSGHRSRPVDEALVDQADLILAMTASHRDELRRRFPHKAAAIHTLKGYAGAEDGSEDVEDPFGGDDQRYRAAAEEIRRLLEKLLNRWEQEQKQAGEKV